MEVLELSAHRHRKVKDDGHKWQQNRIIREAGDGLSFYRGAPNWPPIHHILHVTS
jgi:hypothetical protein